MKRLIRTLAVVLVMIGSMDVYGSDSRGPGELRINGSRDDLTVIDDASAWMVEWGTRKSGGAGRGSYDGP
jgi:hypothetical protein